MKVNTRTMRSTLTFDPTLTRLPLLFEADWVARFFEGKLRDRMSPGSDRRVLSSKLQDVKYQPQTRCVATYLLTLQIRDNQASAQQQTRQTIGVIDLDAEGVQCSFYDEDRAIPWLALAGDPQVVGGRLAVALCKRDAVEDAVRVLVTPVRYKPALRCVFRYDVTPDSDPHARQVLFGKLLRDGDGDLARTIAGLHQASLESPHMPRVLPVLAYWSDIHTVLQPALTGGIELNTAAFDDGQEYRTKAGWLFEAGRSLGGLHECKTVPGPVRTIQSDLAELRDYAGPVNQVSPALAAGFVRLVGEIERSASEQEEPEPVASHGAFRTDQFMIEDGRLVMIDVDSFCWANRARDLGNFLAYLDWKEIRRPSQAEYIEQVRAIFLQGYTEVCPPADTDWFGLYRAASLLKIAGRRYRSLSFQEWPLVGELINRAANAIGISAI